MARNKGRRYGQKWSEPGTNLHTPNGQMFTHQLMSAMGVKPGPKGGWNWPDEGLPITKVGDTYVKVGPANRGNDRRHKSSKHRAFARCNNCLEWIPAGRLGQHRWACDRITRHP